jgi:transposase
LEVHFFMAKYSLEIKLKAVSDVLELNMSPSAVAKTLNTVHAVIQRWVARYEKFGVDGLSMKSGTYTGDFKVGVVEYIHENNMSLFSAAAHFGIPSDATVGNWERIYWEDGPEALYKDNRGRKCKMSKDKIKKSKMDIHVEEDLIAEVQRLRMENEYLKKLNALVQAKEKSVKKTK